MSEEKLRNCTVSWSFQITGYSILIWEPCPTSNSSRVLVPLLLEDSHALTEVWPGAWQLAAVCSFSMMKMSDGKFEGWGVGGCNNGAVPPFARQPEKKRGAASMLIISNNIRHLKHSKRKQTKNIFRFTQSVFLLSKSRRETVWRTSPDESLSLLLGLTHGQCFSGSKVMASPFGWWYINIRWES